MIAREENLVDQLPFEAGRFFSELKNNNNRIWFNKNKQRYQANIVEPLRQFVVETGRKFLKSAPEIVADPRVDKSIFRIHRDVRFSHDKSPYKTHQGIIFWNGNFPKMESPGFYPHFDTHNIYVGGGYHRFPNNILKLYRKWIGQVENNSILNNILKSLENKGFTINGKHYKRIQKDIDPNIANKELLLFNGLWAGISTDYDAIMSGESFTDFIYLIFEELFPLYNYLTELLDLKTDDN